MANIERIESDLYWRTKYLQVMMIALKAYLWSKDPRHYEYAKYFGQEAAKFKHEV